MVCLILVLAACGHHEDAHLSVPQKLKKEANQPVKYTVDVEDQLAGIKKVLVQLGDSLEDFYVPARTTQLKSFPCSNCHTDTGLKPTGKPEKAHWDVHLEHASIQTMECQTCHDVSNPEQLLSITGKAISLDHSYQLCGQCHSEQIKDWKGGAHGKRKAGWAPPRVVNTCVECHNPHKPAFEPRWPARLNTQSLKQDKE